MTSRRAVLQGFGATAAIGWTTGAGATGLATGHAELVISESFVFPEWLSAMAHSQAGAGAADRVSRAAWHARAAAPPSAVARGSVTLLSLPAPGVETFAPDQASELARTGNDRLARVVGASSGRLAGFATVAAFDPRAADEAERAIAKLNLAGISLGVNGGMRLTDHRLRPLFNFAAAARVPVYLPASYTPFAGDAPYRAMGAAGVLAGAARDSSRHASELIFGGVLDDLPDLTVVLARLGEGAPYWCSHLAATYDALHHAGRPLPRRHPLDYFADNIIVTTADMRSAETFAFCDNVLGSGRTLLADTGDGERVGRSPSRLNLAANLRASVIA